MLLSFDGQLLGARDGSFVATEGRNKGTEYAWTDLQFHNQENGLFVLRTAAPVTVEPSMMGKPLHWDLHVEPRGQNGKSTFKVVNIQGSKSRA